VWQLYCRDRLGLAYKTIYHQNQTIASPVPTSTLEVVGPAAASGISLHLLWPPPPRLLSNYNGFRRVFSAHQLRLLSLMLLLVTAVVAVVLLVAVAESEGLKLGVREYVMHTRAKTNTSALVMPLSHH